MIFSSLNKEGTKDDEEDDVESFPSNIQNRYLHHQRQPKTQPCLKANKVSTQNWILCHSLLKLAFIFGPITKYTKGAH